MPDHEIPESGGQPARPVPPTAPPAPPSSGPYPATPGAPQPAPAHFTPAYPAPPQPGRPRGGAPDPLSPAGLAWVPVSPALARIRVILALIWCVIPLAAAVLLAALIPLWFFWLVALFFALLAGWLLWLIPRQVRAIGYAEREDDLLIRRGILFRSLVVVPYGRMQYVDVSAGPLARSLGIASVKLHTASASTDAHIPGLPAAEAARLREQLASRGEAKLAGL